MAEEENGEDLIFGLWTKEDFADDIVFCLFAALIGFLTGVGYKMLSKWLAKHKWFEGEG